MAEKTVLIVEDNDDNRYVYATFLRHNGYRVLEAMDGEEGVRLASEALPDLVLMDISVPGMDGWEATRLLKKDSRTAGIPVVALTAHALAEHRELAARVGCDGYVAKPCDPSSLLENVRQLLGTREA
jgi:two-component system, cell cycle response regulator DivK